MDLTRQDQKDPWLPLPLAGVGLTTLHAEVVMNQRYGRCPQSYASSEWRARMGPTLAKAALGQEVSLRNFQPYGRDMCLS